MIAILLWALIALGVGFYDGYAYQNEPSFIMTFLAVVVWGVIEQFRWSAVNGVTINDARGDTRWDKHFKVFAIVVFLSSLAGSWVGFNLST